MDLFAPKLKASSARKELLKRQVTAALSFVVDPVVMVTELACADAGCPDVETIIAVLPDGQKRLQVTWPGSVSDLSDEDVDTICHELDEQSRESVSCSEGCCNG